MNKENDINLEKIIMMAETTYKKAMMLNRYCKAYEYSDGIYEISPIIQDIENNIDKILIRLRVLNCEFIE